MPAGAAVKKAAQPYHEPSAAEWAKASAGKDSRRIARSMMSAPLRPGARVIAQSVEARFPTRQVYTTSFDVGSDASMEWVLWFAEQQPDNGHFATVKPPIPWRRRETEQAKGIQAGRAELSLVIDENGQPSSVMVLKCSNEALKASVAALIQQWDFLPTLKNGVPVPVEALVEITFRTGR